MVSFEVVTIDKPNGMNVILGQAHFIKTVENLHETLAEAGPHLRFGLGFAKPPPPGSFAGPATTRNWPDWRHGTRWQ